MSSFAIFVIIVVVVAGALGWHSGFLKQIGQIAGVVLGIAACRIFGDSCVTMLFGEKGAEGGMLYQALTYIALFLVVYILVWFVVRLVRNLMGSIKLGFVDRLAGALFRITEWLLLLSLLLNLWQYVSPITSLEGDPLFDRVLWFGPFLLGSEAAAKVGGLVGGAIGA